VSVVTTLVVVAVVLIILLVLIAIGSMAVVAHFWEKRSSANRRYDLIERGLDRDPTAGIKEITEAIKKIDGDLPWGRHRNANDHNHRPLVLIDDNGFPSSDAMPQSLPARPEPDS
jgi:hypothetical protein